MALRVRANVPDAAPTPWRLFWIAACGLVGIAAWCAVRSLRAAPSEVLPRVFDLVALGFELACLLVIMRPGSPGRLARSAFGGVCCSIVFAILWLVEARRAGPRWEREQLVLELEWLALAAAWLLIVAVIAAVAGPDDPPGDPAAAGREPRVRPPPSP